MCECIYDLGGPLEPEFGVGVSKGHDFVGDFQHLLNGPCTDGLMFQTSTQVQPPRDDHVVFEDEVLFWE